MVDKIKKTGRPKKATVTIRERKLIKAQLEGHTLGQSAKIVGMNKDYASVVMNKPQVKEKFTDLLDKAGLSDSWLSNKIKSLADAKETKFFANQGIVLDQRDVEAIETQRKMTEFACRLKGHLVDKVEGSLSDDTLARLIMIPIKPPLNEWKPPDDDK